MKARRLASVAGLLVLLTAAAVLAVGVQPARAAGPVTLPAPSTAEPFFNPANQAFVSSVMQDIQAVPTALPTEITNPATGADITTAQEAAGLAELELAAGTLPTATVLTLGGAALYTGWKIGSPLGGFIYKKITGDSGASPGALQPLWKCTAPSGSTGAYAGCPSTSFSTLFPAYGTTHSFWFLQVGSLIGYCTPAGVAHGTGACNGGFTTQRNYMQAAPGTEALNTVTSASTTCEAGGVGGAVSLGDCAIKVRTAAEMRAAMNIAPSNSTEYAAANQQVDNSSWDPTSVTPNVAAAQQQAKNTSDANAQAGRAYIDCLIDPSWCANPTTTGGTTGGTTTGTQLAPVYLPVPLPGETLESYVERLRAKQYVGAITVVEDPMSYPSGSPALQLSPHTVTQVNTGTSVVPVYDGATGQLSPWPADAPQIQTSSTATDIQITEVPGDYVPASGGGPALDFSPFTGMSNTCNFPFGVLCWVGDAVGAFNAPPTAPDLNWTMPDLNLTGIGMGTYTMGGQYDVNLGTIGMDTYMGWIRALETFVLWAGAIWYVGSRLVGLKGGGDPSDAVDEAYGGFTE